MHGLPSTDREPEHPQNIILNPSFSNSLDSWSRMFSFVGDTVLDPFCGTGTTMIAAMLTDRNSIGVEIDPEYCRMIARYLKAENSGLFSENKLLFEKIAPEQTMAVMEDRALYEIKPAKKKLT